MVVGGALYANIQGALYERMSQQAYNRAISVSVASTQMVTLGGEGDQSATKTSVSTSNARFESVTFS
jgi:hypothetical protein